MVVTKAESAEPRTLDPQLAQGAAETNMLPLLYDTLVYRTRDHAYAPFLAESWVVADDGKSITLRLRQDAVFHDGTVLTSEAVVFTFNRFQEKGSSRSPLMGELRMLESVEVAGEREVRFTFQRPTATFLNALSQPYAGILNPAAVEAAGEEYGRRPVGTGPFMLSEWQTGQYIVLVPNPRYAWGPPEVSNRGVVHIDQLVIKFVPDEASQLSALRAGEIDITYVNLPDQVRQLVADPQIQVRDTNSAGLYYLAFNLRRPPLDKLEVRQALSHAVNKDEIVLVAFDGMADTVFSPLPPILPGFSPELEEYELKHDPDKARRLLSDAGLTIGQDGLVQWEGRPWRPMLITSGRGLNEAMATVLEAQFRTVGVSIDIRQMEVAAAIEAANNGEHDLLLWRYDWSDPDALYKFLSTDQIGAGNRAFYSNPRVDELLIQGQLEMDQNARLPLYIEAQKLILQDAPWQPLATPLGKVAARSEIKGLFVASQGRLLYNDVTVER